MADKKNTIFTNLNRIIMGTQSVDANERFGTAPDGSNVRKYNFDDKVIYTAKNKEDYEKKLSQIRQQKLLNYQWVKAGADTAMESMAGYTAVKLMYRDCDLMDGAPEIGAALDIMSEEVCNLGTDGKILHITSRSKRIQSILEDLFTNRLRVHMNLGMIVRETIKYGNSFMLLNIDEKNGILGWKQLPVYEIDRVENGYTTSYASGAILRPGDGRKTDEILYVWNGHNEAAPYRNFQMAHFRLLNDSFFLPYGVSALHKARRAWRMWSMMEDAMLIYRLDKSIERRVFKIYVGGIDDDDVEAYVQQIANNFKRTPIIDPETGQIDLRKNFMDVSTDFFIPVRTENASNPIETLQGAQNQTAMDDINYMQNKIFAALRVPKTFLNFQEAQGKGQNLGLMDIRFARMINRIQQYILAELNKVAMIHLYLLGMEDEITNFTLSMNNPSNQIEAQEIDNLTKRVAVAAQLLADPGNGIQIYSLHKVLRDVMKLSDAEILDMINEIRLEKAMAAELAATQNIIKKTGIFDKTDRIYGDFDALYGDGQQGNGQQGADAGGGMPGGGGGMPGGAMPMGDMGAEGGDMGGEEGSVDMGEAPGADSGMPAQPDQNAGNQSGQLSEGLHGKKYEKMMSFTKMYMNMLYEATKDKDYEIPDVETGTMVIEEDVEKIMDRIEEMVVGDDALSGITDDEIDELDEDSIEDIDKLED